MRNFAGQGIIKTAAKGAQRAGKRNRLSSALLLTMQKWVNFPMKETIVRRHPAWWLLPLGVALPFLAAALWFFLSYGSKLNSLMNIALKLVVIP